ncbi:MAG: DNA polymerase III subunit delta' [Plesiomonas sp.]|uniref:DNA polymerase III subunit delta' n=1 Tax=Plesiomonas sp. TaxID=2486279 RepID=UPI003F34F9E6
MLYPWLTARYQQIVQPYLHGQGHHALLLSSLPGMGVESLANALSTRLLCSDPQDEQPCGQCHSCQLIAAGTHPDLYTVMSEAGKTQIGVDRIRQVCEKLYAHAQQGGAKVVWISQAEKLNEASANALLKTLEEPPAATFFLLAAGESDRLLPTITSRCQRWYFTAPSERPAIHWVLKQWLGGADNNLCQSPNSAQISQAQVALRLSQGAPLAALALLSNGTLLRRQQVLTAFQQFMQNKNAMVLADCTAKESCADNLAWIISLLNEANAVALGASLVRVNSDMLAVIDTVLQHISVVTLQQWLQQIIRVRHELITSPALNTPLLLADLWFMLHHDI